MLNSKMFMWPCILTDITSNAIVNYMRNACILNEHLVKGGKGQHVQFYIKACFFQHRFHVSMIMNNNFHPAIRAILILSFQQFCTFNYLSDWMSHSRSRPFQLGERPNSALKWKHIQHSRLRNARF